MKLNPDCVHDVMLAVEGKPFGQAYDLSELCAVVPGYKRAEIANCCLTLWQFGFLIADKTNCCRGPDAGIVRVREITYTGYLLCERLRRVRR